MPVVIGWRFKTDLFRSGLSSALEGMDYQLVKGNALMPIQLVSYNDTEYNAATAIPGDIAADKYVTVLDEGVVQGSIEVLGAMTAAQVLDYWKSAGNSWALERKSAASALNRAIRPARRLGIQPIP